jgi:hypothetical protein
METIEFKKYTLKIKDSDILHLGTSNFSFSIAAVKEHSVRIGEVEGNVYIDNAGKLYYFGNFNYKDTEGGAYANAIRDGKEWHCTTDNPATYTEDDYSDIGISSNMVGKRLNDVRYFQVKLRYI